MRYIVLTFFFAFAMAFVACGDYGNEQPGGGGEEAPSWAEVKVLIDANCTPCHSNGGDQRPFDSEARFVNSTAESQIQSGSMPPNTALSAEVRGKMLAFLGSN